MMLGIATASVSIVGAALWLRNAENHLKAGQPWAMAGCLVAAAFMVGFAIYVLRQW